MALNPDAAWRSAAAVAGHYAELELPPPPPDRPFVYINMVSSVDGKATVDGSERGLGSADDKRMMQELRSHADAVLNGAATLRISGSSPLMRDAALLARRRQRGQAEQPIGVIVSRRGALPLDAPFFTSAKFEGAVVVTEAATERQRAAIRATGRRLIVVPDERENGAAIVRAIGRELGVRRLLCEGGPTINQTLLRAGVVDELFLTFAPWLVGGKENLTILEGEPFGRETMPRLRFLQALHDEATDELFLHYAVASNEPPNR
ncbi:MAG TPA: dihydrofolate reductase family protein [Dehalococcoidia bacterium]|nr:dihydrofolate reductase family protein [Dehalococcoidia bacterium]